jgi:hypothetical protein
MLDVDPARHDLVRDRHMTHLMAQAENGALTHHLASSRQPGSGE